MSQQGLSNRVSYCETILTCLIAGFILLGHASVFADDEKPQEIESRGIPSVPQTGAPAQQKFQLPTWPQKFAVEDRKPASLGFAVTQPGPLVVDVQWQGPQLEVTLRGPSAQPIVQRGQGQVHLTYQVTPQDVQRGILWVVNLAVLPNTKGQATGQVTVQHPPVNEAQAEAAVRTRVGQAQQQTKLSSTQIQAQRQAILQAHKNEDARQYQEYIKATALQADAFLKQKGFQGQIQSRALKPDLQQERSQRLQGALQLPPPPPPPLIASLSVTYATPGGNVVIQGSGFTNKVGTVLMTTTNAAVQPEAKVVVGAAGPIWTDTLIQVTVPELTGVTVYNASFFLVVPGDPITGPQISNAVSFLFVPRQQTRVLSTPWPGNFRLASMTGSSELGGFMTEAGVDGEEIFHNRVALTILTGADIFFGHDGHDWFFENRALQNGWRVTCVEVVPYDMRSCNPSDHTVYGISPGTGAYINSVNQNAGPIKLDVRWWFDAFIPTMSYHYFFVFTGPENVPDGLLCFTVAACSQG